jgi:hypothetical protein
VPVVAVVVPLLAVATTVPVIAVGTADDGGVSGDRPASAFAVAGEGQGDGRRWSRPTRWSPEVAAWHG